MQIVANNIYETYGPQSQKLEYNFHLWKRFLELGMNTRENDFMVYLHAKIVRRQMNQNWHGICDLDINHDKGKKVYNAE